jgi:hypothetical protein
LTRYLSDPIYHAESFWSLPCDYVETVYKALQKTETNRLQAESMTTALLTDTVLSVVHSLYGKEGNRYKSNPQQFLPFYQPLKDEDENTGHELSIDTIKIFMDEYKNSRVPTFAILHLAEYLNQWSEKIGDK